MPLFLNKKTVRAVNGRGRYLTLLGPGKILAGILLLVMLKENPVQAGQSVSLGWDMSPDLNAAGYNIYFGIASRNYTNTTNAGNAPMVTIDGLVAGTTYYFTATTYDVQGQESAFSNEAVYIVPSVVVTNRLATTQIRRAPAGQFLLTIVGPVSQGYYVEATVNFSDWAVIGTVMIGAGGSQDFTDLNAASFPRRFYRTREIP